MCKKPKLIIYEKRRNILFFNQAAVSNKISNLIVSVVLICHVLYLKTCIGLLKCSLLTLFVSIFFLLCSQCRHTIAVLGSSKPEICFYKYIINLTDIDLQ